MNEDVVKHPPCIPWDSSSSYGAQMLSHDFVKELPRESPVWFWCGPIWTSTTLVMLMSICIGDARPSARTVSWGATEMVVERAERKRRRREEEEWSHFIPSANVPSWNGYLTTFLFCLTWLHLPWSRTKHPVRLFFPILVMYFPTCTYYLTTYICTQVYRYITFP